ncbi:trypsin-like peptidase domain-containing protein [Beduinella massiliensis]|uniref:trypsin-like peptidase domain-containing protein n=1 Tax=Beduinella massiliensis TaxID=1852363 RepID=UPI000C81AD7E
MKNTHKSVMIIAVMTALLLALVTAFGAMAEEAQNIDAAKHFSLEDATAEQDSLSVKEIVKKCQSSIVAITTETTQTVNNGYSYGYNPFSYGYSPFGYGYNTPRQQEYKVTGAASGIIISEDGYIVTNAHVVEGADAVKVALNDGTEYEAKVLGYAKDNDIAVCKIDATGLNAATFGDSDTVEVGELAVVIGNPLGQVNGAVTAGIISALNYPYKDDEHSINAMQTDAAINQGNSGGALFNSYGEVIGVVFAKTGGSLVDGIGYAIPVNDVKTIIEEIVKDPDATSVKTGKSNVMLGVTLSDITEKISEQYDIPVGAYVESVEKYSAAERAGLERGDVILEFAGQTVSKKEDVTTIKNEQTPGDDVEMKIWRNGNEKTLNVRIPKANDVTTEISKN